MLRAVLSVVCFFIAYSSGQYQSPESQAAILKYENEINPDGSYKYSYETGNKISVSEVGNHATGALMSSGQYSYTAPDGQEVFTYWVADQGGFRVSGSHIPTPPPVPPGRPNYQASPLPSGQGSAGVRPRG